MEKIFRTAVELRQAKEAYDEAIHLRQIAVSRNNSLRCIGRKDKLPPVPVPPKPEPIMVPIAYDKDGTYQGLLYQEEDLSEGMHIKWERFLG